MLKSVVYTVIPGYVNIRYTSSALDCGFEPISGQSKDYANIYIQLSVHDTFVGKQTFIRYTKCEKIARPN